jgi:DNA-binding CsgD family transcriptional regulator
MGSTKGITHERRVKVPFTLTRREAEFLALRRQGKNIVQICNITGCTNTNVTSTLSRAEAKAKAGLQKDLVSRHYGVGTLARAHGAKRLPGTL